MAQRRGRWTQASVKSLVNGARDRGCRQGRDKASSGGRESPLFACHCTKPCRGEGELQAIFSTGSSSLAAEASHHTGPCFWGSGPPHSRR